MSDGKKQGGENWRDATGDDVAEVIKTGKPIPARFKDDDNEDWLDCSLAGWKLVKHLHGSRWVDVDGVLWKQCQVYREPAPTRSPKDGCRMLEDNEEPIPGDFINWGAGWNELTAAMFPLALIPSWFCRPIKEPVESGPPSSIGLTYCPWTDTVSKIVRTDANGKVVESISAPWNPVVGDKVRFVNPNHSRTGTIGRIKSVTKNEYLFQTDDSRFGRWCVLSELEKYELPVPKGFRLLGDEPRLASDGYWSLSCKDWLVIGDRVEEANRDKWPAIRFVVDEPRPVKHQSQIQVKHPGQSNSPGLIMQIRLPVPASVLGKLGDMLEKHYPGSTMRQVGGYLVFEEPSDA